MIKTGGAEVENGEYGQILDAMPGIGVYVIREEDHGILYYNRRFRDISPEVRPGTACHEVWKGSCDNCPLLTIGDRKENHTVSYNDAFGGVVDIEASRILWEGVPAFVVTITPRREVEGYTYRKIFQVDFVRGSYRVLKAEQELMPAEGVDISAELEKFARSGAVHPEDVGRFSAFVQPERLRSVLSAGKEVRTCIYRRRMDGEFRWNLMEIMRGFGYTAENPRALLCIRDVDDVLREGLAHTRLDRKLAAILQSRFSVMNTVNLESGQCERINLSGPGIRNTLIGEYEHYISQALVRHVHPEDAEKYRSMLALARLREKAAAIEDYGDETFQYRTREEPTRWIELHIIYTRQEESVMVNILGQDVTREKCRAQERLQALEDRAHIISSLSSLFFSTYYVDVEHDTFRIVTQLNRVGDVLGSEMECSAALRIYAEHFIHPEDRERYLEIMNVENWRNTLRWWQPSVSMEYRRLPENPEEDPECTRVRATAVVAQIGVDDLPETVVYIAQDVTDSRVKNQGL